MPRNNYDMVKAFPVEIILRSGTKVQGNYVETINRGETERKIFIPISNRKELVIKNLTLPLTEMNAKKVATEISEYMEFLVHQANQEFPDWIKSNGTHAETKTPYTEKDIEYNWKLMKSLFGRFRMAVSAGFVTSHIPCKAGIVPAVDVIIQGYYA